MSNDVAADELLLQMSSGRAPFVLDVRSRAEFETGYVPGSREHAVLDAAVSRRHTAGQARRSDRCLPRPRPESAIGARRPPGARLYAHRMPSRARAEWRASGHPEQRACIRRCRIKGELWRQSARSASVGFKRAARVDGTSPAATDTARSRMTAAAIASGSPGATP